MKIGITSIYSSNIKKSKLNKSPAFKQSINPYLLSLKDINVTGGKIPLGAKKAIANLKTEYDKKIALYLLDFSKNKSKTLDKLTSRNLVNQKKAIKSIFTLMNFERDILNSPITIAHEFMWTKIIPQIKQSKNKKDLTNYLLEISKPDEINPSAKSILERIRLIENLGNRGYLDELSKYIDKDIYSPDIVNKANWATIMIESKT